jgi:GNAT superfamily N-acetyltransferase
MKIAAEYVMRPATVEDIPVILSHRERMFREMGFSDDTAMDAALSLSAASFAAGLADGGYRGFFLCDRSGAIAAGGGLVYIAYYASPRDPHRRRPIVVNMYTEHAHRRRGLARLLMETMIAHVRGEGYSSLYLHATPDGRPLYEDLGFVATNEMRLPLR